MIEQTPEDAFVAALLILARRGRAIREQREREERPAEAKAAPANRNSSEGSDSLEGGSNEGEN